MEQLHITDTKGQLHVKAPVQHNGSGQLYIYNQSHKEIGELEVYLNDGVFEIDNDYSDIRFFLKLKINSKTYVGALRHLPLDNLYNFRDLGGYEGKYGSVKWGMVYRSDALCNLSVADENFLKKLKIDTVIDFRSPQEIKRSPDHNIGEKHHFEFDPSAFIAAKASEVNQKSNDQLRVQSLEKLTRTTYGLQKLTNMKNQMINQMHDIVTKPISQDAYARFLQLVLRSKNPILFHCQGGKDRTGWASAIFLGLLGIDDQTIIQDYLLTKKYNKIRNEKRMSSYAQFTSNELVLENLRLLQMSKIEYLEASLKSLRQLANSYEEYAEKYLDFTSGDIQKLREKYLN